MIHLSGTTAKKSQENTYPLPVEMEISQFDTATEFQNWLVIKFPDAINLDNTHLTDLDAVSGSVGGPKSWRYGVHLSKADKNLGIFELKFNTYVPTSISARVYKPATPYGTDLWAKFEYFDASVPETQMESPSCLSYMKNGTGSVNGIYSYDVLIQPFSPEASWYESTIKLPVFEKSILRMIHYNGYPAYPGWYPAGKYTTHLYFERIDISFEK